MAVDGLALLLSEVISSDEEYEVLETSFTSMSECTLTSTTVICTLHPLPPNSLSQPLSGEADLNSG
jgi:hypothetical protein